MNAYEISIWRSVKHNGQFVVNNQRLELVHARNKQEAESKVTLAKPSTKTYQSLTIDVSAEVIYSTTKIGTVKIERFYTYSNGRTPILMSDFRQAVRG